MAAGKNLTGSSGFVYHMSWYTLGALIPIIINVVKTPIFTRHYSPAEFGLLGLVTSSLTIISIITYSWLASNLWRYYQQYSNEKRLPQLYSSLIFLLCISTVFSVFLVAASEVFFKDRLLKNLILYTSIHYLLKEFLGLYLIIVRMRNNSSKYNLITVAEAIASLIFLFILSFFFKMDISAMLICFIIADAIILLAIVFIEFRKNNSKKIARTFIEKSTINKFIGYGFASLVTSLFLIILTSTDKYIIALSGTMEDVGIYSKAYDISQMSVLTLILIFFNAANPTIINFLENRKEEADQLLANFLNTFIILLYPTIFLASVFCREINSTLLGPDFKQSFVFMPYFFHAIFLFGLIKFYEIKFKFRNKEKKVAVYFAMTILLNTVLKAFLVPQFGQLYAAVSLLLSFAVLLLLFIFLDKSIFLKHTKIKTIFSRILLCLVPMLVADQVIRYNFEENFLIAIIEGVVFAGIFIIVLFKPFKQVMQKLQF